MPAAANIPRMPPVLSGPGTGWVPFAANTGTAVAARTNTLVTNLDMLLLPDWYTGSVRLLRTHVKCRSKNNGKRYLGLPRGGPYLSHIQQLIADLSRNLIAVQDYEQQTRGKLRRHLPQYSNELQVGR